AEGAEVSISGFAPAAAGAHRTAAARVQAVALPAAGAAMKVDAARLVKQAGAPTSQDIANAGKIRATIPERLRTAAYMADGAPQIVLALTLGDSAELRERQLRIVEKYYDATVRAGVEGFAKEMAELNPLHRLPLAALAFPALRRRPRPQLQTFLVALKALIDADGEVAVEEYCLAKLITVQVVQALDPSKSRPAGSLKLPACAAELADVFAVLARYGSDNAADAERAYLLGMHEVLPDATPPYAPPNEWSLALDKALPKLELLTPAGKELLLQGLVRTVGADGVVTITEAELLRTVCAALHCPLPPILEQAA
ncbi:MAG TPA: peptidase M48, partial [Rudaea sp.]|nr:peptidase M48 [Rudaea sp.]